MSKMLNTPSRNCNRELVIQEQEAQICSVKSLPGRLQIDVTGRCNMKCPACYLTVGSKPSAGHLEPTVFARLRSIFPFVDRVTLYGTGEPLLSRYFPGYFREVAESGAETYFTTNGTRLTPEMSELLVKYQLTYLSISFSGADRHAYARIHGSDYFDQIVANVEHLNEIKLSYGSQ